MFCRKVMTEVENGNIHPNSGKKLVERPWPECSTTAIAGTKIDRWKERGLRQAILLLSDVDIGFLYCNRRVVRADFIEECFQRRHPGNVRVRFVKVEFPLRRSA